MLVNENYEEILSKSKFAMILISGEGCANCISMLPMVLKYKEHAKIDVFVIEADMSNSKILEKYEVSFVPTILLISHGQLISKIRGYQPEEVFEIYVETKLEEINKNE